MFDPQQKLIGVQCVPTWEAGTPIREEALFSVDAPKGFVGMVSVDVQGVNVEIDVVFGTSIATKIVALRPPCKLDLNGTIRISARNIDPNEAAFAALSVAHVMSGSEPLAKSLQTVAGIAPRSANKCIALTATNLTVAGVAVALAVGDAIDIIQPTVLVSGSVIWEHVI